MPRPKRLKVAPSAPAPRVRKTSKVSPTVESQADTEKEVADDLYNISDPDEGLVTSAQRVKRSNGKGKSLEIVARSHVADSLVGGLDNEDVPNPNLGRLISGIPSEESLLRDLDLESSSPSMEAGGRHRSSTGAENSRLSIGNFKRRPRQNSILGRAAARARSSSIESSLAEDNGLMSVGRKNKSSLENGNSHRHRREGSVMRRGRARSSSIGLEIDRGTPAIGSVMRIGTFKRRVREPSILGTTRKKQQQVPYDESENDEDDFNPDDESTPLNLSKTRTVNTSSAPSSSNSRKRKLSGVEVLQSQTQRPIPSLPDDEVIDDFAMIPASGCQNPDESDVEEIEAESGVSTSSSAQELPMPSIEAGAVTPEPLSETMAPPQSSSSSPPGSPVLLPVERLQSQRPPSRGRRPLRNQPALLFNQDSPPSSPPPLTHSPNRPARASARQKRKKEPLVASNLSTAQLQALLPRRRQRARDEFDIAISEDEAVVSGLESDDDELTHSTIVVQTRRSAPAPAARPKPKSVAKLKAAAKVTYASKRQATSDKENEEDIDPDDSLAPVPDDDESNNLESSKELEKRVGKELKRAAKKFAEVDKWEMEFEDVTASSSSPKDAR